MNSSHVSLRSALAALIGSLVCLTASAQITNGNFSSGFATWSTFGDANSVSGAAFITTASLDFDDDFPLAAGAFNSSGVSAGLAAAPLGLEEASGLTVGALDLDLVNAATEGSAITQTFSVNAGDTLSFDYQFFTNEGSQLDYSYFTINGSKFNLAQVANATTGSAPYAFETALLSGSYLFETAGLVTLGFGVVDIGDFNVTSALLIDNVTLTAIPEPSTYAALMAAGVFGFAALRRRRTV